MQQPNYFRDTPGSSKFYTFSTFKIFAHTYCIHRMCVKFTVEKAFVINTVEVQTLLTKQQGSSPKVNYCCTV